MQLLLLALLLAATAEAKSLLVAVAANMMPAMQEIKPGFKDATGADLTLVSGSSGKFAAQVRNGAPFDVFVSADTQYPDALDKGGFTAGRPVLYAYGTLVLWTAKDLDPALGLAAASGSGRIALADPKVAPYGRAAVAALKAAGVWADAEPKLVFGESIGQVNQFVMTKAVDFGLTSKSTVLAPLAKGRGRWAEVDRDLYAPVAQSLVVLKRCAERDPGLCRALLRHMASPRARETLARFGYELP